MRPLRLFAIILALSSALNASAQYKDESSVMKIKGSKVYLGDEKQTLEQAQLLFSDVAGIDRSADYLKYRHWYKAGLGMTIGGASLMALGGLTYLGTAVYAIIAGVPLALTGNDMPAGVDIAAWTSVISLIGGAAVTIAGIPVLCIYENKLDDMADEYNSSRPVPSATLSFGTQRNGIGLALNF